MFECSNLPELLELTSLAKWKSAVTSIGTYSSHLFLVSKTVARPALLLLPSILHKVWASPWNSWGDFWNKCVIPSLGHVRKHASDVYLPERILAWMKAYELRIARVKNCRKMFAYFSLDDLFLHLLWWNLCFAAENCFAGIWLFFFIHFSVKLEELVTDDPSLLQISSFVEAN